MAGLFALAALSPLAAALAQGTGYWHTSGSVILDSNNQQVRIAGVNWYGFEGGTATISGLYEQDYKAILAIVKAQGYNSIRVPLSSQMIETPGTVLSIGYSNSTGAINTDLKGLNSLQVLDKIVEGAGTEGLKIIFDHHRSDAGASAEGNGLWYTPEFPDSAWVADWVALAKRYAGNPTVVGFDLHNEPHLAGSAGACWDCGGANDWHLAAERAGNAVLAVNPHLLIFVEGVNVYGTDWTWWGGNLEGVAKSPVVLSVPDRLVYSPHDYGPDVASQPWFNSTTTYQSLVAQWTKSWAYISENNIAPLWLGEFGTTNNASDLQSNAPGSQGQWFQSLAQFLGSNASISWAYWALNGEDSFGLLDGNYDPLPASATKQSMLAALQMPLTSTGTPPAAPAGLAAIALSASQVALRWTPIAASGATYNVYFGTVSGNTATLLVSGLTSPSYLVTNLNCCTLFYFTVKAVLHGNTSAASNQASATTTAAPAPTAPSRLTAKVVSATEIDLNWMASTSSGVTYNIYASATSGTTGSMLSSGSGSTAFQATGLKASTTYTFTVRAAANGLTSPASNLASATTPAAAAASCHVSYDLSSDWGSGFVAAVSITNSGTTALASWKLNWSYSGNQRVSQSWNGNYAQTGEALSIANASWNGAIAPGATSSGIGFQASYTGRNVAPTTFYLNGVACK